MRAQDRRHLVSPHTGRCPHVSEYSSRTECAQCRAARETRERRERQATARAYWRRTHHCAGCGQPDTWCLCSSPCDCADLHVVGCGIGVDPADAFSTVPVSDEQAELF